MYVILQGSVDIYINTLMEGSVRIAHTGPGNFFGEMAIFDNLPRSASCVAHEPTVCIAIDKSNLQQFIAMNPGITEKLIISLSERIRSLNDQVFKADMLLGKTKRVSPAQAFAIPQEHTPVGNFTCNTLDSKLFDHRQAICPVCEKPIVIPYLREQDLHLTQTLPNQRPVYKEGGIVWHQIWSCIQCGYSNFHMNFFKIGQHPRAEVLHIVNEQRQYRRTVFTPKTAFDTAAFQYYQAIHFNTYFNKNSTLLLARLWQNLCWMYGDVKNIALQTHCREQAVYFFRQTLDTHPEQLPNVQSKRKCCRTIASLLMEMGQPKLAESYTAKLNALEE